MGTCCSKKSSDFAPITPKSELPIEKSQNPNPQTEKAREEKPVIKEKPIINHRKNKQIDHQSVEEIETPDQKLISADSNLVIEEDSSDLGTGNSNLINNGSAVIRTSSCTRDEVEAILIQCGRLSGSSSAVQTPVSGRKYSGSKRSFDFDQEEEIADVATTGRESRRQSRPSPNRRRTPSRERDREQSQRSGSRERNINGGNARRVSRSPGRRSESPMATCHNNPSGGVIKPPGKMVSVPATVSSSLAMDKSSNGEAATVKKVAAKRNAAAAASPNRRSRSPAARSNANANLNSNQNQAQQGGLSRSNSRKAEQSPYRRNPLGEIDTNAQKQGTENVKNSRTKRKETTQAEENAKAAPAPITTNNIGVNVVVPSAQEPKPQAALTRTRSSRLSRDLDNLNLEAQNPSPTSSYTALLLEDIQSFHNKNPVPVSSLPQCLSKACSILDEIADLNSSSGPTMEKYAADKLSENKEPPLMETEVVGMNDLMEPSFQKYVTVKRGNNNNVEREEREESSGSNSFVGGPQHWISSSLWETNSTDSTDCWASSSRSNTREDDRKKRGIDCPKMGIGQGRLVLSSPAVTAATI